MPTLKGIPTMSRKKRVINADELMDRWYGEIPGWDDLLAEEEFNMQIGQAVYDLREAVGMSQADLAKLVGTTQAIISKIENADYNGSAIDILKRICFALHTKIRVSCAPASSDQQRECQIFLGK